MNWVTPFGLLKFNLCVQQTGPRAKQSRVLVLGKKFGVKAKSLLEYVTFRWRHGEQAPVLYYTLNKLVTDKHSNLPCPTVMVGLHASLISH